MSLKSIKDVTYFKLNNEINRPVNGQIPLHKDKEALEAFFAENVRPNTKTFDSIEDKINYLIEEDYLEAEEKFEHHRVRQRRGSFKRWNRWAPCETSSRSRSATTRATPHG